MLQEAAALAERGEYELASAAYARIVGNGDPEVHVAALLGLADARYRVDDDEGALQSWIVATQAPETSNSWRAWKSIAATRVRQNDLPGAARAYREAERRAPGPERPEIASRLGWLSKEMGQDWQARRYFGRSRTGLGATPIVTYAILAVTIGIGIPVIMGFSGIWYQLFALIKPLVAEGEIWRLVTVVLVHADGPLGIVHLGSNMYALYLVGPLVETLYGRPGMALIYVLCATAGSTASFLFSATPIGVGASGAIFGLFGMLIVGDRVHRPALGRQARALVSQMGMLVVINLVFGFTVGFIDNAAHIGGLVAGAWLGLVLRPKGATLEAFWQRPAPPRAGGPEQRASRGSTWALLQVAGVAALVGALAAGLFVGGVGR